MAVEFDENIDYAEKINQGIADNISPEEMKRLRDSRNAKINSNSDLYGQYKNDGVDVGAGQYASGWKTPSTYTPGSSGSTPAGTANASQNTVKDYTRNVQNFYDAAAAQKRKAYQAKLEQTQANYRSQLPKIAREYENVRNDVYANSRRDAFGNSEALAAQGLGRSNANAPASGYGETSRIALNTNMHNNLNQATIAEQDAKDQISKAILDAGFTTSIEEANALAEIKLAEGSAVQNQWNADRNFSLNESNVTGTYNGQKTYQATQDEIKNAEAKWKATGVADEYVAKILGIPVGTKTLDYSGLSGKLPDGTNTIEGQTLANNKDYQDWTKSFNLLTTTGVADEATAKALNIPVGTTTAEYMQIKANIENQEWSKSYNKLTALGYADEETARILGIPVGTTIAAYNETLFDKINKK